MDQISRKVNQWIDSGKDPRSAHWQGGLEAMLDLFSPHVEPGKLTPVGPLEEADIHVFKLALAAVDLSPNLIAAFLPPSIAGAVIPPESAKELLRIDEKEPSYKIIVARPGKELRIVCAEISDKATKPGADIFEAGALLGTYDFPSQEVCLSELTKLIQAHAWEKGTWSQETYERYTFNWFERSMDLSRGDLLVEQSHSFFHSPTLIKSNRVDALFHLIHGILAKRFNDPKDPLGLAAASIKTTTDHTLCSKKLEELAGQAVLQFLNHIRQLELMKFEELSNAENEQFKKETSRTILKVVDALT
ncbi:MAG: hypothetical protein JEZ12_25335 [Desulfobacterium sp.]|nr:hypothetical protein [Desulfobacterium sp.]